MVEPGHPQLSAAKQCLLMGVSRSSYYYQSQPVDSEELMLMRLIDEQYTRTPFYGARRIAEHLRRLGYSIDRKRVGRLMRRMGLKAVYPRPKTSAPHPKHPVYPYLLRDVSIDYPNQVWVADITYIPLQKGFLYLVAVDGLVFAQGAFLAAI
uniref:HTH-like domain-containing protein n=1 Tax=Candidatus Kentrum eta TaxID=2126337 RepID=A0A450VBL0_9GAMM|nr:MAG: HTH-like domain-containing protein [Candidatus Kentron sp. H]VFK02157.1 MAG: HTH-like domain-containing protein [Candidatus Kentron sp. H]VFK05332.1 MAG: HTH-like domain-containing protein [Candidatus Kentron sp. H]